MFFFSHLGDFLILLGSIEDLRKGREVVLLALFLSVLLAFSTKKKKNPMCLNKNFTCVHNSPPSIEISPRLSQHNCTCRIFTCRSEKEGGKMETVAKNPTYVNLGLPLFAKQIPFFFFFLYVVAAFSLWTQVMPTLRAQILNAECRTVADSVNSGAG